MNSLDLTATDLAAAIRAREVSPVDHMAVTLHRVAAIDPLVGAFIAVDAERAMARARRSLAEVAAGRPLGPLHGVPFAVKDMIDVRGMPTTCRSSARPVTVASRDAGVIRTLRAAGAIPIGKLAMEEFGIGSDDDDGDQERWPVARNPWNPRYSAGGSSSGSAAAVAARLVPIAVGTDTGGSVRCPAALCGVVGLKPSYGRISRAGVFPLAPSLDHVGIITRTVEDGMLAFGAITRERRPVLDHGAAPLHDLTIGVIRHFFTRDLTVSPEVIAAIDAALTELAGQGARIVDVEIKPAQTYEECGSTIQYFEAHAVHRPWWTTYPDRYGPTTASAIATGAAIGRDAYQAARRRRRRLRNGFMRAVQRTGVDVLVTAVTAGPAWPVGDRQARDTFGNYALRIAFNVLGLPAITVPVGFSTGNLPLAMQIVARPDGEPAMFRAAAAYQSATDWHRRTPAMTAAAVKPT